MTKGRFLFLGMLAMVLALGFVFVACDNGSDDVQKSIKITGIVNPANTKGNAHVDLFTGDGKDVAGGDADIVNQTLLVNLYGERTGGIPWTGNGKWRIRLKFRNSIDNHQYDYVWKNGQEYDIKNAVTELNFADFVLVWEEGK